MFDANKEAEAFYIEQVARNKAFFEEGMKKLFALKFNQIRELMVEFSRTRGSVHIAHIDDNCFIAFIGDKDAKLEEFAVYDFTVCGVPQYYVEEDGTYKFSCHMDEVKAAASMEKIIKYFKDNTNAHASG